MPRVKTGRIIETDALSVIDTSRCVWEENPGIPGARMKALSRHEDGWESVILNWLPPDLGGGPPHRHYHRSVREHGLVIDGELPMAEFVSSEPGLGVAVLFRAGFYMDRAPGCVHGLDPQRVSQNSFTILEWRDGPGTYLMEDEAAKESVVEDAPSEIRTLTPASRPGVVIERDDLTLLDVLTLPWVHSEHEARVRIQMLSEGVTIAYAPPGVALAAVGSGQPARALVLFGSLELTGGENLGQGCFVESRDAAVLAGTAGEVGCRVLRF
jgi:hypothetical protein